MPWNIIGQDQALAFLGRSLARGSLPHALLLTGPAHVGKMALAVKVAQALNCTGDGPPCGSCPSCQRTMAGKHPDVTIIGLGDPDRERTGSERDIGIERVRTVQHSAALLPFEGRFRVFIIDGADALSHEAANALLKILEEPGAAVVLVLTTEDEEAVLPTVRSRCQRLALRPAPVSDVAHLLETEHGMLPDAAAALARESAGRTGWAIAAARDPSIATAWRHSRAVARDLIGHDLAGRFQWAAQNAADFGRRRADVLQRLDLALTVWHDLLLLRAGCPPDLLVASADQGDLSSIALGLNLREIAAALRAIGTTHSALERNANPRLALETLMLDLPRVAVPPA